MAWPSIEPPERAGPLWARLAWLAVYWGTSVAVLAMVAGALKWWIGS